MSQLKKTLVLGASANPERYSNMAVNLLVHKGYPVVAVGNSKGNIGAVTIHNDQPNINDIHTITLYLNPSRQVAYYDYILSMHPKRIIFNPGTENPELMKLAKKEGIITEEACTLVMLRLNQY